MTTQNTITIKNNIPQHLETLCKGFYKREKEISAMLLSILAGYNSVFIGKPGIAKSAIANRILSAFEGPTFSLALSAYTEIEELFGPLSIKDFREKDKRTRLIQGYLPSARYAFLDEIFKAQSSTLNALLLILNERTYIEEGEAKPTQLDAVIAASNERPDDDATALADRMCMYIDVLPTRDENFEEYMSFVLSPEVDISPLSEPLFEMRNIAKIKSQILNVLQANKAKIIQIIQSFNSFLKKKLTSDSLYNDAKLSDRSSRQCAYLLATACVMRSGSEVQSSDAWFFEYMARADSYVDSYKTATLELLMMGSSLQTLKNSIMTSATSKTILSIQSELKNLPYHWQIELNDLINSKLSTN